MFKFELYFQFLCLIFSCYLRLGVTHVQPATHMIETKKILVNGLKEDVEHKKIKTTFQEIQILTKFINIFALRIRFFNKLEFKGISSLMLEIMEEIFKMALPIFITISISKITKKI